MEMGDERLIELVKQYSYLYDHHDKMYGDAKRKEDAWRTIGKNMNMSGKECKKTWNVLRDSFRRARKRQKEMKSLGNFKVKKWKYDDELTFLVPFLKERPNKLDDELEEESVDREENLPERTSERGGPSVVDIEAAVDDWVDDRREFLDTNILKKILDQKGNDDIDAFFASMAATVKTFPPTQRALAKAKVFSIISNLELKILNHSNKSRTDTDPIFDINIKSNYSSDDEH